MPPERRSAESGGPPGPGGSGSTGGGRGSRRSGVVRLMALLAQSLAWLGRVLRGRVVELVGGPARARVILLFGGVLALSSAQISTIGAVAPQLEQSLHIGNTKIGLLNSVALVVGAVAVIPVGLLVDRFRRIPMLAASMLLWSITTILGAIAGSYSTLLLTRIGLGAVTATAGPAIASLTGDYFPSRERARVYGYILSGEIAGTAAGFLISGTVASVFSWRVAFFLLGIPGLFLARSLWRTVPEPKRGGQSRLRPGTVHFGGPPRAADPGADEPFADRPSSDPPDADDADLAYEAATQRGFQPNPELVLNRDPDSMSLSDAVRYVLSIPTNMLMIFSSSLGYFFFAGLQTFALVFVRGHYHASQATATLVLGALVLGSLLGTLVSGPLSDAIVRRGQFEARVWVPALSYLGAAVVLIPGLLSGSLGTAVWFDAAGAALISAANPPLDAARLDIMPSGLWGRAESTRTFLRSLAQALAPLLFGAVADVIAGFEPQQAPIGTHTQHPISAGNGLQASFLIMLITLGAAGFFLLRARHTYPTDVATAGAGWKPSSPEAPADAPGSLVPRHDRTERP
ncbi:MAG TPA: MFS transporter [Solirubrobacteraceae bacterium]